MPYPCWLPACSVIRVLQPVESTEFRLKVSDFTDTTAMYERTLAATQVRCVMCDVDVDVDAVVLKRHTTVPIKCHRELFPF